jgi:hypothetical protein
MADASLTGKTPWSIALKAMVWQLFAVSFVSAGTRVCEVMHVIAVLAI